MRGTTTKPFSPCEKAAEGRMRAVGITQVDDDTEVFE
jgi:hypothetical protein